MPNFVSNYFYERRAKFARSAGVVGGLYLVGQYASARIADMRASVQEQRAARDKYVRAGLSFHILVSSISVQHAQTIPAKHARHFVHDHDLHAPAQQARTGRDGRRGIDG